MGNLHGLCHSIGNAEKLCRWHDEAIKEPVQITKHGRETAYLVSAETFNRLWSSYRRVAKVAELSEAEMNMILAAEIAPKNAYEIGEEPAPSKVGRRSKKR